MPSSLSLASDRLSPLPPAPEAALGQGPHRVVGWGQGPPYLPILVPQHQQHRPTVAFHLPVQAPQAEAISPCAEGQAPGMSHDSGGEVEAELGTGLEVSGESASSPLLPPCPQGPR